jgi:hypothetical protein
MRALHPETRDGGINCCLDGIDDEPRTHRYDMSDLPNENLQAFASISNVTQSWAPNSAGRLGRPRRRKIDRAPANHITTTAALGLVMIYFGVPLGMRASS